MSSLAPTHEHSLVYLLIETMGSHYRVFIPDTGMAEGRSRVALIHVVLFSPHEEPASSLEDAAHLHSHQEKTRSNEPQKHLSH